MANTVLNKSVIAIKTNKSGGAHAQGDVSVEDTSNANSVVNNTSGAFVNGAIWVCLEPNGVANDALGAYASMGYVPKLTLSGSASLGDFVKTHTVAKQGVRHAAPVVTGDFAMVLGTGTSPAAWLFGLPYQGAAGAAPTDAEYIVITANATLSAERVLEFLGKYQPDKAPASPSAYDDEFSLTTKDAKWTVIGSLSAASVDPVATGVVDAYDLTTLPGVLLLQTDNTDGTHKGLEGGFRQAFTPGAAPWTLIVKVNPSAGVPSGTAERGVYFVVSDDTTPTNWISLLVASSSLTAFVISLRLNNASAQTITGTLPIPGAVYLALMRSASNTYYGFYSFDGISWGILGTITSSMTVAYMWLAVAQGSTASSPRPIEGFEFVRFHASTSLKVGDN